MITRRQVLALGGSTVLGAAIGGVSVGAYMSQRTVSPEPVSGSRRQRASYEAWRQQRRAPYFIAHRGAGDVVPEHTLPGYLTALDWGAECLEISVVMSADGELYCLHDLTLDRTTTLKGPVDRYTSETLNDARVNVPRLGPRWVGANMPNLPRFADVLSEVGGRAVICIEAKNDSAYPSMLKHVENAKLLDTIIVKVDATSSRLDMAKKVNIPVFAYLGNPQAATATAIKALAKRLDPERDSLVLPAFGTDGLFSADLMRTGVDTGVPVWVFPVHRRYEVDYFSRLGVQGMVTPDLGYVSGTVPSRKTDDWASGGISPGELTKDPYGDGYALQWGDEGVIGLGFRDRPSFLTLGQFSPIAQESFRLVFDASFDPIPTDTWQHLSVAFGHRDDRYYEHRLGVSDGYHALLRADGNMAIYSHVQGDTNGRELTKGKQSTPLKRGMWSRLTLDVTPTIIRWSRDDGTSLEAKVDLSTKGYLHVGSSANDGRLNLRSMSLS
jgi:hypothetical protein